MQTAPLACEPLAARETRLARAAATAVMWIVGLVPVVFLRIRCTFAAHFHRPCPGCGMTRAMQSLLEGRFVDSLRMHPLAVPLIAVTAWLALAMVASAYVRGSPFLIWESRVGRAGLVTAAVVNGLMIVLWGLRAFGLLGGNVPVY
jgi:hypothetical protein